VLEADWLRPGQHVTAMGSDQEHKNEIDAACFSKADLYVPDRLSQTRILGELRSAIAAGLISAETDFAELGTIVAALRPDASRPTRSPSRTSPEPVFRTLPSPPTPDCVLSHAGLGTNFES
jgi:ornithine cyclodeaminase/alanine dehydrogenase-like protein (mu-crystallin family)